MSLVDPTIVAAIKARPARESSTPQMRADAIYQGMMTLSKFIAEYDRPEAEDDEWRYSAAHVLGIGVDLVRFSAQVYGSGQRDPRRALRERLHEALGELGKALQATVKDYAEQAEAGLRAAAEQHSNALLSAELSRFETERAQLIHAADQAQREAAQMRRAQDAAQAQLTRERAAHAQECAALRDVLSRERAAYLARERTVQQQLAQLKPGRAAPAATPSLPAPKEAAMPDHSPAPPTTVLECASLCLFLRQRHGPSVWWDGAQLYDLFGPKGLDEVKQADLRAWRSKYPTPAQQMAQLRAAVSHCLAPTEAV